METIKGKLAVWSGDRALKRTLLILAAALAALIVGLCISIHMRSNIQTKYSAVVTHLQEQTYQELSAMVELFSRVDDPNVDVRYKLIPELKARYSAVVALNRTLTESCGERRAVLTSEQTAAFDAAFEEYALAYRQGIATGLAQADMSACMQAAQTMIDQHYSPPVRDEDKVIVINASSGKVETK